MELVCRVKKTLAHAQDSVQLMKHLGPKELGINRSTRIINHKKINLTCVAMIAFHFTTPIVGLVSLFGSWKAQFPS